MPFPSFATLHLLIATYCNNVAHRITYLHWQCYRPANKKKKSIDALYTWQDIQDKCFSNPMMWITIWKLHSNVINSLKFFSTYWYFKIFSFSMECIFYKNIVFDKIWLLSMQKNKRERKKLWIFHWNIVIFLLLWISMVLFINSLQRKLLRWTIYTYLWKYTVGFFPTNFLLKCMESFLMPLDTVCAMYILENFEINQAYTKIYL